MINRNGGRVLISGAVFEENHAHSVGGAIFNERGTVTIDDSADAQLTSFTHNSSHRGGAIYNNPGQSVNIASSNFKFSHNEAGDAGGALYNDHGTISIKPGPGALQFNVLGNNSATKGGGAIFSQGGSLALDGLNLNHNRTTDGSCGAVCIYDQSAVITRSLFHDNEAHFFGGAIYTQNSTVSLIGDTFTENRARLRGGESIDVDVRSDFNVVNSTFAGSSRRDGIHVESGGADIAFSTLLGINWFRGDRPARHDPAGRCL